MHTFANGRQLPSPRLRLPASYASSRIRHHFRLHLCQFPDPRWPPFCRRIRKSAHPKKISIPLILTFQLSSVPKTQSSPHPLDPPSQIGGQRPNPRRFLQHQSRVFTQPRRRRKEQWRLERSHKERATECACGEGGGKFEFQSRGGEEEREAVEMGF